MSRLQEYRRRMGAAGVRVPGAVRVAAAPQGADGAARELAAAVNGALGQAGRLLAREHVRTERTRMDESLLAARKEFSEWQATYMQEHQGGNALHAGEDFRAKMDEIAGKYRQAFNGPDNEVFGQLLGGQMAALRLRAGEQGDAYAARQRGLWENSVLEGRKAQLLADAESEPGNGAWLDFQLGEYGRALEARGLDATAPMRELADAVQLRRGLSYVRRGELDAATGLLQGWKSGPLRPGDISARYESGADGSAAIGYDGTGGTSYGRWQFSSTRGSMDGFLRFLEGRGGEAAAVAARLRAAGPADTGGTSGAMPEAWKRAAQTPGFGDWEREFAQREFYEPAVRGLPAGAAAAVEQSPMLQQMVWSTAVQHGAGGAADIFRKAWRDGMTDADFVRAAYEERAGRFGSSAPEVRASVQRRLRREAGDILGGLSGAGGVNGMSLQNAMRLEGAIDRERAELEAAERKRKEQARTAAAGFADAAACGATDGDFSAAAAVVAEVEGLDADAGQKLRARLNARRTAWDVMRLHADQSLLEQRDAALSALDAHETPADARDALSPKSDAESLINQRIQGFRDDPAAFAAAARPELLRDDLSPAERTRRLLEAQATLGRGLSVAPRVLTKAQAADTERAFAESDPQTRLQLLTDMRAGYGPYFTAAAAEARLPAPVIALGSTLDRLPPSRAAVLLAAATAKESDIPGVDKDARASARDAVAGLDFMRQLTAASRRFPGNEAARALAASWEKMLTNAALMGVEPDEAATQFEIAVEADPDDGGGHILLLPKGSLPGGWDVDDVAEAAEAAREVVRQRLTDALPRGETPLQRRMLERGARHAADSGVWVSAADGGSVHLVDEVTGRPVMYPDGAPVAFSLRELAAVAADRRRATAATFSGRNNRLFGGR